MRLPGAGGAPEIAASAKEVIIILRQKPRAFVEELAFVTSVGHRYGGDSREKLGYHGAGPTVVITDLGILRPDPETKELTLAALHPGATVEQAREATGWDLQVAEELETTDPPTERSSRSCATSGREPRRRGRRPKQASIGAGSYLTSTSGQGVSGSGCWNLDYGKRREEHEPTEGPTRPGSSARYALPIGRHGGALERRPSRRPGRRRPRSPAWSVPASLPRRSRTSTSGAPTRPARTTATSPGCPSCWPASRRRSRVPP